ncbi:MAG TPA: sigma-54 dependent transcriptional regulator [Terracidiphilus sp.]|nr:sigma-54 dependent transcriptional regulator [Terracidiphilus sp.]
MIKVGLYSEDHSLSLFLSSALGKDYQVMLESDWDEMSRLVSGGECEVSILDLNSTRDSLDVRIACVKRLLISGVPSVLLGADELATVADELVRAGAFGYCRRPLSVPDLKAMLSAAYQKTFFKRPPRSVPQPAKGSGCDRLIGSSPQMLRSYQLIKSVSNLNAAVLVTGESGTGKELIARAIHNLGVRADRPFVAVSCGAIPETLIEAELFGHEKGAFTGTVGARAGYFEQAADGTLFLDEIGDLSLFTQVKLLRVLQQLEFSRLGTTRVIPLRARLIFATHRDLAKLVAEGKFRQDLFYRINVMRIDSPSLREHAEDVPEIAWHFLNHYSRVFQKQMDAIEPDAMELLQNHSWPGNVRELENVMQRAIILAPGSAIRADDLSFNMQEEDGAYSESDVIDIGDFQPLGSFERQLRDYKIKLAVNAVREHNGNKTLAARSLCISRSYLHRLLRLAERDATLDPSLRESITA